MKTRLVKPTKPWLAAFVLAQLGVAASGAAQVGAPVSSPPPEAAPPPPSAVDAAAPAVEESLPAPLAPAPVEPVPVAPVAPAPPVLPAEPLVQPAALVPIAPAGTKSETDTPSGPGKIGPRFGAGDAVVARDEKPLFKVGRFAVRASGYVQAQYQAFQQSRNELSADGTTLLNQSGFSVPRARALIEGGNDWSTLVLEYDLANLNSAGNGVQRAEATLLWRNPSSPVPYIAGTLGVFRTPFGYETPRSARDRVFTENATVTQAFFPGQSDTGARVEGGLAWFRYAVAFVNGQPINEPRWGGRAPTKQGDILGRLGLDTQLGSKVRLVGGASLLKGRGFTAGSAATKDTIAVRDTTEQGAVNPQTVILVPGRAATPSQTFNRWATGVDLELSAQVLDVWRTWIRGEFMFGSNMDRGLFISNPLAYNGRGYGAVTAFENLLWQVGLLGVRFDFYQPNPDSTSNVAGATVKVPQRISTTSVLGGFQLPGTRTRLFAQYDRVKDHLALGLDGRPADLKNDRFTLRLQVSLW